MAYDDLQHQVVDAWVNIPGASDGLEEGIIEFEPAGGLARREVAELVGLEGVAMVYGQDNPVDQFLLDTSIQFTTNPESPIWQDNISPDDQLADDSIQGQNTTTALGLDDDEPGHLVVVPLHVGWTSGTMNARPHYFRRTFPQESAGGPVLDRHDKVYAHQRIWEHGPESLGSALKVSSTWYWDVAEE